MYFLPLLWRHISAHGLHVFILRLSSVARSLRALCVGSVFLLKTKRMKPPLVEGFILYTGPLDEQCLNYLTHNPAVSESSKPHAGYSDHPLFTSELTHARRSVGPIILTVADEQPDCWRLPHQWKALFEFVLLNHQRERLIFFWDSASYHIKTKYSIAGLVAST